MKVKVLIIIQFLLIVFSGKSTVTAQNLTDFLPLQVGNVWVYQCSSSGLYYTCGFCTGKTRVRISGSTVLNGKTYYQSESITSFSSGCMYSCGTTVPVSYIVRVDSQSANVFISTTSSCLHTPGERMLDSFKARLGDTIGRNCPPYNQFSWSRCTDTNNATVLGSNRRSRIYTYNGFESGNQKRYAIGIGCYFASTSNIEGGTYACLRSMTLLGCVINGVVYGDTTMPLVGITQVSTEIPRDFALHQNYPNPFNPVTNIKFELPKAGLVRVIVIDAIGNEIAQIVNQQMQPGSYSVDWNASNYPSGVYFYKLETDGFVDSKKMVLIK